MTEIPRVRPFIEWERKYCEDPFSSKEPKPWSAFSDVETAIIEEAYQKRLEVVQLDDYYIDFKHSVQISNKNAHRQKPIRRKVSERTDSKVRADRFMSIPITLSAPFAQRSFSDREPFFNAFREHFNITSIVDPLTDPVTFRMIVEKAASGLIIEGKIVGKQKQGEWMAQQLLKVQTPDEAWECCIRLYCMESFLYRKLNEYMRLVGDKQQESIWRNKIPTFGPFAFLLFCSPERSNTKSTMTVYRGANLPDSLIQQYREKAADKTKKGYAQFPAFTSTSRNRAKAEYFDGNVLFIIEITNFDGCDVSSYSNFDEEEQLLDPYFSFYIQSCEFVEDKNKWEIHLQSA